MEEKKLMSKEGWVSHVGLLPPPPILDPCFSPLNRPLGATLSNSSKVIDCRVGASGDRGETLISPLSDSIRDGGGN